MADSASQEPPDAGLLSAVLDAARSNGWRVFRGGDSHSSTGRGFPDLVLCREKVIFVTPEKRRRPLDRAADVMDRQPLRRRPRRPRRDRPTRRRPPRPDRRTGMGAKKTGVVANRRHAMTSRFLPNRPPADNAAREPRPCDAVVAQAEELEHKLKQMGVTTKTGYNLEPALGKRLRPHRSDPRLKQTDDTKQTGYNLEPALGKRLRPHRSDPRNL